MTGEGILAGGVGFLAYLALVSVLLRLSDRRSPAAIVMVASVLGYVGTLVIDLLLGGPVRFWSMSATYWFLSLSFLMVFGAIYKSISLRILLHLLNQPGRSDRYQAVLDRYVKEESYQRRLEVMVANGLATRESLGLQLTTRGHRIASLARAVQVLANIRRSG
jgi:hypothetical protein